MRDWLTHLPWITRQSWPSPYPVHAGLSFFPSARHTTDPRVILNHSTETLGFPSYNRGAAAPHFTGNLVTGQVRQHVPLSWGARCLAVSAGGVRDLTVNTSGVIQIEWIGAVTPGYPERYGHYDIPGAFPTDARAQRFVARLWRAIAAETGIPLQMSSYAAWVPYPASYGAHADQRLTSFQFRDARGLLGHQHAPANDHGDGLLGRATTAGRAPDMDAALALARAGADLDDETAADELADARARFDPDHLAYVEALLDDLGAPGADVWAKTLAYQIAAGLDPEDGLPGPSTTKSLEDTMRKIDQLLAEVRALRTEVRATPTKTAGAVWARNLYGMAAHWWLRRGSLGTRTDHPNYPADPGSPADVERRVAEKILGTPVAPYPIGEVTGPPAPPSLPEPPTETS